MVLKLYGHTISTSTKLVATVLHEKQIPYEFVSVNLFTQEQRKPTHLARNPFGQLPCIDDNSFILYESRAICRYLEETYPNQGTKLIPSDPKKRALVDQAMFSEVCGFDPPTLIIIFEAIVKKFVTGGDPDPERIEEEASNLAKKLDVYEKILSKQKYLTGDELSLADLCHLPNGTLLPQCGVNVIQERPNVARWFNDLFNRPSWQKVKDGLGDEAESD